MACTVFVTVGTTSHPRLLTLLSQPDTLQVSPAPFSPPLMLSMLVQELRDQGCKRLVVQAGGSQVPHGLQEHARDCGIEVHVFAYKDSIAEDIAAANLVISHAGT